MSKGNYTIYKYTIGTLCYQEIELPADYTILKIDNQHGKICMWILVNLDNKEKTFLKLRVYGTGHPIKNPYGYQCTVAIDPYVWHIFLGDLD